MPKPKLRIGVDLGGTKIEALAMGSDGKELVRQRVLTPQAYDASVEAIAKLVTDVETKAGRTGTVGIGIPGIVVPDTGLVKNANSVWLNGQPLAKDLEERLGRPIRVMNDADCFALSEASDGAAAGARVVFGVIIGTGVGGGIVVDGKCLAGANLIAGEWGHNPLPWMDADEYPGPSCYCGRMGCIEMWVSGPGFERDHAKRAGANLAAAEIVRAAAAGEPIASMSLSLYCDRLDLWRRVTHRRVERNHDCRLESGRRLESRQARHRLAQTAAARERRQLRDEMDHSHAAAIGESERRRRRGRYRRLQRRNDLGTLLHGLR